MTQSPEKRSDPALVQEGMITRFLRATEIDTRLLGMIGALVLIWVGFQVAGDLRNGNGVFASAAKTASSDAAIYASSVLGIPSDSIRTIQMRATMC